MTESYTLFETARGACGLAWGPKGITLVQLPEASPKETEARVLTSRPNATRGVPGGEVSQALSRIAKHLGGASGDLSSVCLDMGQVTPFRQRVYTALRAVEVGSFVSYGELAALADSPGASRAVGQAMAQNPFPVVVPCHRVLASGKRIGGFSAHGGAQTKVDLLAAEGVLLPGSALGLGFEPLEAIKELSAADKALGALIEKVGPPRLLVDPLESPFVALVKAIVYQQLTGKAASTSLGRLKDLYGGQIPNPKALRETPDDQLRAVGLSRAKAAGLKDLAAKVESGVVPSLRVLRSMDDEAIIKRLTVVRGVGRWTVEMLLIFRLGRPDVFPLDDYGVRKGLTFVLGEPEVLKPRTAAPHGERWRPYRTLASWYLWRAAELGRAAFSARSD